MVEMPACSFSAMPGSLGFVLVFVKTASNNLHSGRGMKKIVVHGNLRITSKLKLQRSNSFDNDAYQSVVKLL
jgi:hypothetical protein